MSKYSSVASITTLWENNPDTPITAANLSRLQDLTTSYLNTDDESFGVHVEGSILYPHPNDARFVVLKRGTIIQIVNESTDMVGEPIIPKNSMYRVFDVGLEDIILTYADTDETQLNKTTWGTGNNEWFVFLCDKDDSVIYSKGTVDAYGGGAQILISKYSDYPRGQIPGRPSYTYSTKDVRLIGGFKTNGNNIISSSVWDIAGKYDKIKAKAYFILDEYKAGGAEYRQIQLSDLNTSLPSQFNSDVGVLGSLTIAQDLSARDITGQDTTFTGAMSQTGNVDIFGNISVSGTSLITGKLTTGQVDVLGNILVDSVLTVKRGTNIATFDSTIGFAAPIVHTGNYTLTGNLTQTGILSQSGNVTLGGSGRTVSLTGTTTVNGGTTFNGNITIPSIDNLTTIFSVNRDTQQVVIDANGLVLNSEVQINDGFGINSGAQDITLYTTRNILSSVGSTYEWRNSGNMKIDNGVFTVQQNSSNKIFEVLPTNQINANAAFSAVIPTGKTFTVKNHLGSTIFGVEYDNSLPSEKRVAINTVLDLSASSADNALRVTGNGYFSGDLTVDGVLYADIQGTVVGGASSWTNNLTINLTGDVGGQVTFNGDEGTINLVTQVYDDSHIHDTRYYTETELQTSGSAIVHWGNISNKPTAFTPSAHTHDVYLEESEITWSLLQGRGLVGSTGGDLGVQQVLARIDHKHDSLYSLLGHNHNGMYAPVGDYAIVGNSVNFSTMNAGTVLGGDIAAENGLSVYSLSGINFRQDQYAGSDYKLYSSTDGSSLIFNGVRVVTSVDTNNVAPKATQLNTPQTLAVATGNGISGGSLSVGRIGDGSAGITLNIGLDWGGTGTSTLVARSNHTHSNNADIGGPYSLSTHTHDTRYYLKSEVYTKAEVQAIINGLIDQINALYIYNTATGMIDSREIRPDIANI